MGKKYDPEAFDIETFFKKVELKSAKKRCKNKGGSKNDRRGKERAE